MPTYIVQTSGYYQCPEFTDCKEARACLMELVRESMQDCRRKYGQAHKHCLRQDSYEITLGADRRSALWNCHAIIAV